MDLLIFGGQSNMQGQTECCPDRAPVDGAFEYRYLGNALIPLAHPVGEDIGDSLLLGAHMGYGSMVPQFCRAYSRASGRQVVAVHVSRGATTLEDWSPDGERYNSAIKKIRAAVEAASKKEKIGRIAYVWLQGESDALRIAALVKADPTNAKEIYREGEREYANALAAFRDRLVSDVKIELFGIIKVGYFAALTDGLYDRAADEAIMRAQETVSKKRGFAMLTRVCPELSLTEEFTNPYATGHYNNAAMDIIGTLAGRSLADCLK